MVSCTGIWCRSHSFALRNKCNIFAVAKYTILSHFIVDCEAVVFRFALRTMQCIRGGLVFFFLLSLIGFESVHANCAGALLYIGHGIFHFPCYCLLRISVLHAKNHEFEAANGCGVHRNYLWWNTKHLCKPIDLAFRSVEHAGRSVFRFYAIEVIVALGKSIFFFFQEAQNNNHTSEWTKQKKNYCF